MVENAVEKHFDATLMGSFDDSLHVLFGTQARVNAVVVLGIVAVASRLEYWRQLQHVEPELLDVRKPVNQFANSIDRRGASILLTDGRSHKPQWIDVPSNRPLRPLRCGSERLIRGVGGRGHCPMHPL